MPSITSDVSYGSTRQGTPGIEYAVPAPTTAVKSKQARESLTTVFSSANVTDSMGAAAVVHPVLDYNVVFDKTMRGTAINQTLYTNPVTLRYKQQ